jgi:periplasmic protein CpxP/Spy
MKTDLINKARLALVMSTAACAILIGGSCCILPAAAQAQSTSAGEAQSDSSHVRSEGPKDRIKHLHDLLKITPNQEALWSGVARVMLENASAMDSAIKVRVKNAKDMNAVDDLNSYQSIAAAHAVGLKRLATAFAPLYSAMPEAQQKNADVVFGHRTNPSNLKPHG